MKKIIVATALFAAMSFAATDTTKAVKPVFKPDTTKKIVFVKPVFDTAKKPVFVVKPDTAKKPEFKRDSLKLPVLPDSLKAKLEAMKKDFDSAKVHFGDKDTGKKAEPKLAIDSLRKTWEAKRDSQVAKIKDTTVKAKVEARIVKIGEHKAAIKAKLDARKAKLDAKKAVKPTVPAVK
jgi:hypothetical protein